MCVHLEDSGFCFRHLLDRADRHESHTHTEQGIITRGLWPLGLFFFLFYTCPRTCNHVIFTGVYLVTPLFACSQFGGHDSLATTAHISKSRSKATYETFNNSRVTLFWIIAHSRLTSLMMVIIWLDTKSFHRRFVIINFFHDDFQSLIKTNRKYIMALEFRPLQKRRSFLRELFN